MYANGIIFNNPERMHTLCCKHTFYRTILLIIQQNRENKVKHMKMYVDMISSLVLLVV